MVRGKHAIQPNRKAQAMKVGAAITAIAATGVMVGETADAVPNRGAQQIRSGQSVSARVSSSTAAVGQKGQSSQSGAQSGAMASQNQSSQNKAFDQKPAAHGYFKEDPGVPLPASISDALPSDAQLVGTNYAQTPDGTIYNVSDGQKTTDPKIVGTADDPADPLAKSDGLHFVPVPLSRARAEVAAAQKSAQGNSGSTGSHGSVTPSAAYLTNAQATDGAVHGTLQADVVRGARLKSGVVVRNNAEIRHLVRAVSNFSGYYGANWGTADGGQQAFLNRLGQPVIHQGYRAIDVSEWQGNINWGAAKHSGVQAAIIRTNYGHEYKDRTVDQNIARCRQQGIPFGIYMYSIAHNGWEARQEANFTASILRADGVSDSTLSLPVYLDLENFPGHPGTGTYEDIVRSWIDQMHRNGFSNVSVYSYTGYLDSALNSGYIHSQTGWVAQYAGGLQYGAFSKNSRGWQYSDAGSIDGIAGRVDLDAFGYGSPVANPSLKNTGMSAYDFPLVTIPNGEYYIDSDLDQSVSAEIPGAARGDGTIVRTYHANGTAAQHFMFTRNPDGTYTIVNTNSGKALDVPAADAHNGQRVQQYSKNGTASQKWYIRQTDGGRVFLQSALGNYVLDIQNRSTSNGTEVQLWNPGNNPNQRFLLASASKTAQIPTDSSVQIHSALDRSSVVDIPGGSHENGSQVDLYSSNGSGAQEFSFHSVGNGVYTITNEQSRKDVEIPGGSTSNSVKLQQYTPNGTQAQQWYVRDGGNGTVSFFNKNSGHYIDVPGGNASNGTRLQAYAGNGSASQKFQIQASHYVPDRRDSLAESNRSVLRDGTYRLAASGDQHYAIEVAGGSRSNGGNVRIWRQNASNGQLWNVSHDEDGFVTLTNVNSSKALDLQWADAHAGQNVDQYQSNGTMAQKWIAVRRGSGIELLSAVNPDYALDVSGNSLSSGTNIRVWKENGTAAQIFAALPPLTGTDAIDAMADASRNDLSDGTHRFASATNRDFVLDLSGASSRNGANVQLYRSNGTAAQLWVVSHDDKGYVTLTNAASGKVLDLQWADAHAGQNVDQYEKNGTRAQKWIAVRTGSGVEFRSAVNPSFVLDVAGNAMSNGTNVRVWNANGSSAQSWIG